MTGFTRAAANTCGALLGFLVAFVLSVPVKFSSENTIEAPLRLREMGSSTSVMVSIKTEQKLSVAAVIHNLQVQYRVNPENLREIEFRRNRIAPVSLAISRIEYRSHDILSPQETGNQVIQLWEDRDVEVYLERGRYLVTATVVSDIPEKSADSLAGNGLAEIKPIGPPVLRLSTEW